MTPKLPRLLPRPDQYVLGFLVARGRPDACRDPLGVFARVGIEGTLYWVVEVFFSFDAVGGSGSCAGDVPGVLCVESWDGFAKWRTPILTPSHCPPEGDDDLWELYETGDLESDPFLTVEIF